MKTYNERYGGWDYLHIHEKIILWLRSRGAREDQVDAIMKRNPPKLRSLRSDSNSHRRSVGVAPVRIAGKTNGPRTSRLLRIVTRPAPSLRT